MIDVIKGLFDLSIQLPLILKDFVDWWFIKIDINVLGVQLFYNSPIELFVGSSLTAVVGYLIIRIFI